MKEHYNGLYVKLIIKNISSDIEYSSLHLKGTKPVWIYGTPEIHNAFWPGSFPPFRLIVSSIGTYNYNLAQCLGSLLSPRIPSEYSTKDSFTFIEEIKLVSVTDKFLISFDVTSLFKNIPLSKAIDIAINLILKAALI